MPKFAFRSGSETSGELRKDAIGIGTGRAALRLEGLRRPRDYFTDAAPAAMPAQDGERDRRHFFLSSPSSLHRALAASMSFCAGQTFGGNRAPPKSGSGS